MRGLVAFKIVTCMGTLGAGSMGLRGGGVRLTAVGVVVTEGGVRHGCGMWCLFAARAQVIRGLSVVWRQPAARDGMRVFAKGPRNLDLDRPRSKSLLAARAWPRVGLVPSALAGDSSCVSWHYVGAHR